MDWIQLLSVVASIVVACLTGLLALATVWMALEVRKSRIEQERGRKEIAFRSALAELGENIFALGRWFPGLDFPPDGTWMDQRLQFGQLLSLLAAAPIHPQLWNRIIGISRELKFREVELRRLINDNKRDEAGNKYYVLVLYLKQLVCYLICEMRRQGLPGAGEARVMGAELLAVRSRAYVDVQFYEVQSVHPIPPHPLDSVFEECALTVLADKISHIAEENRPRLGGALRR